MRKTRPSCARPLARHHVSLLHQQRRTGPGRRPVPGSRAEAPKQLTRPAVRVVQSVASFSSLLEGSLTTEGFPACPLKMTPSPVSSALRTPGPSLLLCNTPPGAGGERSGEGLHCSGARMCSVGPACLSVLALPLRFGLGLSLPVCDL